MTDLSRDIRRRVSRLRAALARYADVLDVAGDDATRIIRNAQAWEGTLRATSTEPGRGGQTNPIDGEPAPTYGDPAGELAANGIPAYATLTPQLLTDLATVETNIAALAHDLLKLDLTRRRCIVSLGDTDERNRIEELNRTDGLCPTCEHVTCTGHGDDRLRRITVDQGHTELMCDPCRKAWDRRPHDDNDQKIPYSQFSRGRRRLRAS